MTYTSHRPTSQEKGGRARRAFFELHAAPGPLLRMCDQRAADLFAEFVGPEGPTRQQAAVLVTLYRHAGASQTRISQLTGIDRNTLAEMLPRLAKRRLIARTRSKSDARAYEHVLRPEGEALFLEALPKMIAAQRKLLEPVPENLREVFLDCLRRVVGVDQIEP